MRTDAFPTHSLSERVDKARVTPLSLTHTHRRVSCLISIEKKKEIYWAHSYVGIQSSKAARGSGAGFDWRVTACVARRRTAREYRSFWRRLCGHQASGAYYSACRWSSPSTACETDIEVSRGGVAFLHASLGKARQREKQFAPSWMQHRLLVALAPSVI